MATKKRNWMKKRDDGDLLRRKSSSGAIYDSFIKMGYPSFRPKAGNKYNVRILQPAWNDPPPKHYGLDMYCHYGVGPDNGSFVCYESMEKYFRKEWKLSITEVMAKFGEKVVPAHCPICDSRRTSNDAAYIKTLKPKRRVLVWVIDRDDEMVGPKLWSMPASQVDRDLVILTGKSTDIIHVDDIMNGYDISFSVEQQEKYPNYIALAVARKSTPVTDDENLLDRWLDYIEENSLFSVINFVDVATIEAAFSGSSSVPVVDDIPFGNSVEEVDINTFTADGVKSMTKEELVTLADRLEFRKASVLRASKDDLVVDILDALSLNGKPVVDTPVEDDNAEALAKAEMMRERLARRTRRG